MGRRRPASARTLDEVGRQYGCRKLRAACFAGQDFKRNVVFFPATCQATTTTLRKSVAPQHTCAQIVARRTLTQRLNDPNFAKLSPVYSRHETCELFD